MKKCIVKGCTNCSNEGTFVGDLCFSCYRMLTEGKLRPSNSFLGELYSLHEKVLKLQTKFIEMTKATKCK